MNLDATRDLHSGGEAWYRCACGNEVPVSRTAGGKCERCQRVISPDKLRQDASLALTLQRTEAIQVTVAGSTAAGEEVDTTVQVLGRRFGHFEILEPLGQGGMGQVFRALDHSLQRYVAVKILRRGKCQNDERQIELLLQEAVAQARVNHPNVATIYYVGREAGDPFLAMEFLDGGTLADRMKAGPLAYPEIARIALQIVNALHISHRYDIIHGDIKPTNLLIKGTGEVKLSDFGMARSASSADADAGFGGTPNYLAPELLRGETPSIQSDMYALGVTLYELMFGRLPVQLSGSSVPQWLDSHRTAKIVFPEPWPEHIPRGWRQLFRRLLSPEPSERFADYEEVAAALRALEPIRSPAAGRFPRLIAGAVDYALVLFLFAVSFFPLNAFTPLQSYFMSHWLLRLVVGFLGVLPILAYTVMIGWWRQSVGHALMQLTVVNRYGLPAATRTLVTRSLGRMLPLWVLAGANLIGGGGEFGSWAILTALVLAWLWFMLDLGSLMILGQGRSLHDLLARTRVVLHHDLR